MIHAIPGSRWLLLFHVGLLTVLFVAGPLAMAEDEPVFEVGFGRRDITPTEPMPMWGYGDRHDALSTGALDTLFAKAVVIRAGDSKLALVGLDIGRGPTASMMHQIRSAIAQQAHIEHVFISGSHTHHGPVIELIDREGFGRGKFDAAVRYAGQLPGLLIEAILDADQSLVSARMGVASVDLEGYNRNRHTKRQPKTVDPMLAVMRFDNAAGGPIAVLVNFAAHPTMTDTDILKFSADYPGFMQQKVESELGGACLFMQGAAGDMSTNTDGVRQGPKGYGDALGERVLEIARTIQTSVPPEPSVKGRVDRFVFASRVNFANPLIQVAYSRAFFPELIRNFVESSRDNIVAELNTVVLNEQIALVGGSGEFFSNHSNRLKERVYLDHTLFFGYCNEHNLYFPTIEAVSERGYGADATVSPVEIGGGEQMMNRALMNIYELVGKFTVQRDEAKQR